jgi:predicted O-methyltransferase YrrM
MEDKVKTVLDAYANFDGAPAQAQGVDRMLLSVGPETGQLINILAKSLDKPTILELGTSYGYSAIWLAEAAKARGGRVITMELQDFKAAYAREMAQKAGLEEVIEFRVGDAVKMIGELPKGVDFVLMDLWKEGYVPCLQAVLPKLNRGAIIVADNMIYPGGDNVGRYATAVRAIPGMTSILVPVGAGLEISRWEG